MARKKPPDSHSFRHELLDEIQRHGFTRLDKRITMDELNEAHLTLGRLFTEGDFEGAVQYVQKLGLSRRDVTRAWYGD